MNIGQIFKVLLGRIWLVIGIVVIATCITFFINHGKADQLRARATLLIDFQQPTPSITSSVLAPQLQEGYLATQSEIISSLRVAQYVINRMNAIYGEEYWNQLDEDKNTVTTLIYTALWYVKVAIESFQSDVGQVTTPAEEEGDEFLAGKILDQLRVRSRDNTRLIDVIYTSRNPKFAIEMANAFVDAYVNINLEFNTATARRNAEWMNDQLAEFRGKLDNAQRRLTDYEKQTGTLANDGRASIELTHLSELTGQLASAQAEAEYEENKLKQLISLQDSGADLNTIPEVISNAYLQDLKSELRKLESELTEMSTEIGKNHPDYKSKNAEILTLKSKLNSEINVIAEGIRNQAALAKSKVEALRQAQTIQKDKLLQGKESSSDLPALVREIENAQRGYETALQRYEEYNLQSRITQTNAAVLNYSMKANRAKIPTMARNLTLAAILGFILGCGLVLILEFRAPLVRSENDVSGLDLTYLGKINAS